MPISDPASHSADTPLADLPATLQRLRTAWQSAKPDQAQRRDDLLRLRAALKRRLPEMADAIAADFGHRSRHESLLADGMTVLGEIDHLLRHLKRWMRPQRVGAGWRLWPARAEVRPVPVGVVGVIAPWNYPVNLALIPLATAIAAGNHVYLKPSEHTPRTAQFLHSLLAEVFPPQRVAVALGAAEVAGAFAALPLDHLVFTGSTAVGRKVMAAAAPNLTPLTLELGGKSPAIVCADYPLEQAAARLATGKWFNAGQTCIAPDYVLIDAGRSAALVQALRAQVLARYGDFARADDYTRIVNAGQYRRLRGYLDDARARGLEVVELASVEPERAERERLIVPTVVLQPGDDALLMQEEIFGPILPLRSYRMLDEAIAMVNGRDRPLALYPFSHDRAQVEAILHATVAGGVTVNDSLLHFAANALPFGGVGPSGMGAYHGRAGFDAFSKALPILWQSRWAASDRLKPPYTKIARLIDLLLR
ncbi:coniferyl aldehyde dehydrogenase [Xanthomonas graminis]|jgi:coniferyl-aldehyde dehydrogenase|uniref:coniferyl aldehyde dehydrogenase n=1 Tax=Xanthomonas graminis TaxID=3390026 RepID=UPI00029C9567|nr:coniferyl aldehyde dehydrogenase [Xanthomonas translucens]EKU23542.1 putative coniferyl aldehyde dehydrogenase [Xanthomonas translucens pv. graminis ART-Xtg29]OAX58286.1 aldehyde dehydrogenase [Xanthomonas translucens pv. graminis]UKE54421.1 coniferyl aldehyde dehydrogenase [Xanthomonas translucens pv. graminis]WIH08892.1 coniferyl aldehyde dehydrogenase [Xanthomonas translucens pv. graminis]WIH12328.1 coniferyl aldehyde dehydrogenase [Xanthomonas translucens pv. graminis]